MKKSAIILSRFIQTSLAGALSILGFSSCGDQPDMYGTPVGHYEIKGTVTDPNGAPVKDAEIIVRTLDKNNISTLYPGATTDNNGDYTLKASGWPSRELRVVCHPMEETLEPASTEINVKLEGAKGEWDYGTAKTTVDFTLKEKNTAE